jgi:putative transcriptional regulator
MQAAQCCGLPGQAARLRLIRNKTNALSAQAIEGTPTMKRQSIPSTVIPRDLDVAKIRARTGYSQGQFAGSIGVSLGTLRHWEQARRLPTGAAWILLALLDRNPALVSSVLTEDRESQAA